MLASILQFSALVPTEEESALTHPEEAKAPQDSGQWSPLGQEQAPKHGKRWPWLLLPIIALMLAYVAYAGPQYILGPQDSILTQIFSGTLQIREGSEGPWCLAKKGRIIREGAHLRSSPGSIMRIAFPDGSYMRIESEGEWYIRSLQQSPNGRLSQVCIRQEKGLASFVAAPPRQGVDAHLQIKLPMGTANLVGVATFETGGDASTRINVIEGRCHLIKGDEHVEAVNGQTAIIAPDEPIRLLDRASAP